MDKFGGMLPAWDDNLLPEGQASLSENCYLFSGALNGWRRPKLLRALVNSAAKSVYRVPTTTRATADANLIFKLNANVADTVKVGEEVYTFTATVTNPYDVLVGANATASATNLFAALTLGTGAGTLYGVGTCANLVIDQNGANLLGSHDFGTGVLPWIYLKSADFGEAFNTVPVTESTATVRLVWVSTPLTLITSVVTTFLGGLNEGFDSSITGTATWLEFADKDTDTLRSPIVNDRFGRYYFASPSEVPQYNTYDRITAASPAWKLGVPAPGCAPIVSVSGGGDEAVLGNEQSVSSVEVTPGANTIFLIKVSPQGALQLQNVSFMPGDQSGEPSDNGLAPYNAVLYSDVAGVPSALLGTGSTVLGVSEGVTAVAPFLNPVTLLSGETYWIGIMSSANLHVRLANDDAGTGIVSVNTYTNGPPATLGAYTSGQPNWQMLGVSAAASVLEARAYVYTWLTEYSEEGPPSPATLVNGWSNGTWTIDLFTPPSDEMGVTRNITKKRLYRTISAEGGQTTYFLVAELPVTDDTYVDVALDNIVALNSQLETDLWFPPPEGMIGIVALPNGVFAGFKGNEIWFSEPYVPHAWPPNYVLTTEWPVVGLGVVNNSVIACTGGQPYIASGTHPSSMAITKINIPDPCLSRGSIVSTDQGVLYCSPNGLILVTQYGLATNVTELWITREKWRELTPPKYIQAIKLASSYFAFAIVTNGDVTYAQQGFTIELSASDSQSFTIWPQPGNHRLGLTQLTAPGDVDIDNVQCDPWTGIGLLIQDGSVYYYDFSDTAPEIIPYRWKSKSYQQKAKRNFAAMKVYFTAGAGAPTQSATRDESATQPTLGANQYGIIRVYADDVLVTTREIRYSGELLRILSGFMAERWMFEVEARVLVSNVQVATSSKELAGT